MVFPELWCKLVRMEKASVCLHKAWRIAAALCILASLSIIFLFSGQDGAASGSLSTRVTVAIITLATNETPDVLSPAFSRAHHVVRKLAHATEYGMLAASCALMAHTFALAPGKRFLFAGAACLPVAALDEYLQTFRSGRFGSPADVCIDMLGAIFALLLFYGIWSAATGSRRKRRTETAAR